MELLKAGKPILRGGPGCEPVESVRLSPTNLKALAAGLMIRHSKLAAQFANDQRIASIYQTLGVSSNRMKPLTIPQVIALFDALSIDRTGFRDRDIQEGVEAFKKMVQRYSAKIPFPDRTLFARKCPDEMR